LPLGLTLNASTGVLSGTPSATGIYQFVVAAHNFAKSTPTGTLSITVSSPPTFTADRPAKLTRVGATYKYTFAANGYPSAVFSVHSGHLPPGLRLHAATGVLIGTPTTGGKYTFTVAATNPVTTVRTGTLVVTVDQKAHFTRAAVPEAARVGQSYSYRLRVSGYPAPSFRIADGHLPSGLHLNRSDGVLSGRPTRAGTRTFDVVAANETTSVGVRRRMTIVVR
jgi:large repetitive protein